MPLVRTETFEIKKNNFEMLSEERSDSIPQAPKSKSESYPVDAR